MNERSAPTIFFTLHFDTTTEDRIRNCWQRLTHAGIAVPGLTGLRPHITLAAYETDALAHYRTLLAEFVQTQTAFPIRFDYLGIFPESRVVFLAPRVTNQLTNVQAALVHRLAGPDCAPLKFAEHLAPENWIPHCTVMADCPEEVLTAITGLLVQQWEPIGGMVTGIGIVVPPAVSDLVQYPFRHSDTATSTPQSPV
jgi:2'-5' RNA ligase